MIAVTPVRTGPLPTSSFPSPLIRVVNPTSTPATSVIAFNFPGIPSKGIPRARARIVGVGGGEVCGSRPGKAGATRRSVQRIAEIFMSGFWLVGDLEHDFSSCVTGRRLFVRFRGLGKRQSQGHNRHDFFLV